ncbi:MAG: translational GTPase TypA [Alphaproteobacteria bacterium]|uniref:translational GTPase TypA n=1 Tax=Pacificispira sp. TaxID=2888761 RepID=UPI001B03D6F1|nr:translational GTPase TypA [Alphaproteobacteria bacterium]MBO6862483.1 translational GTPase TypA [Alphaproteobacteria bacterium]MEC9266975.1 translational GTPase TypA [Pseudomonadota bacterium]
MDLRNIAIIAHVDHGKTTMVDKLLTQSGAVQSHQQIAERAMDSNDLEKERGITILAKCTSVDWKGTRINIVDTPGHADFGGEVERILSMVDGVVLLVDAAEGPMPQTKFVTIKALELGLKPIVVINKVDKPDARPDWVIDQVFDLFVALDANEDQLDFPVLYASAKQGWAARGLDDDRTDLTPLFETVLEKVAPPVADASGPFRMLVTTLESDPYLGRILTGRIESGSIAVNRTVKGLGRDGKALESGRLTKLLAFRGLKREPVETASAGDIVAIAGMTVATVADTICDPSVTEPVPGRPIAPPTMAMTVSVNDSPLAGREGDKLTGRMIGDRLMREAESNVAIRVTESAEKDAYEVAGRGELQLGVLLETLRREGFELTVGPPRVLFRKDEDGNRIEPMEEVQVDVDDEFSGVVVEKLGLRKGEMKQMAPSGGGKTRMVFDIPSRGLIGYQGEFLADTRGTGILSRLFTGFAPYKGQIPGRRAGVLISAEQGTAVTYALANLEDRGPLFVDPGDPVYAGMILGEHNKGSDLEVNPLKAKQLTNFRAAGKDDAVKLTPPVRRTLEEALAYIQDDERVEVTPKSIRLRKAILDPHERKRDKRRREAEMA